MDPIFLLNKRVIIKNMNQISPFRIWLPRVLSILFVLFLMLFSLDVFTAGASAGEITIGLLVHNIPALILLAVVVISFKYEIVGGIVFILSGIAYIANMLINNRIVENIWLPSLIIGVPAFLIGILFLLNWMKKKTNR